MTRRSLLSAAPLASRRACLGLAGARFRIGVTDWNLGLRSQPEAFALAKELGFEGLEVAFGCTLVNGRQQFEDPDLQARYLAESKRYDMPIAGAAVNLLSTNPLKSDPQGAKWVAQAIPIARKLRARVLLLPFFGKAELKTPAEMDYTADALKDLAPGAEEAGIILALENYRSAEDNVRMIERAGSRAVKVYYDVGNTTAAGFDPVEEIRWLGKDRIAQIHLKDGNRYLGEGKIDFPSVMRAIADIGFEGFVNLETENPSGAVAGDMRRNLGYVRSIL